MHCRVTRGTPGGTPGSYHTKCCRIIDAVYYRQIKNLKPNDKRFDLRESNGDGFGIRVFPTGIKSWIFFYFFEGRKRRMTLGSYPERSLAEARQKHREALSLLNQQIDPGLARKQSSDELKPQSTDTLIEECLAELPKFIQQTPGLTH